MISLSWSRLSDYLQCPLKFKLKYLDKVFPPPDKKSIHLVKGERLHKQLEDYVVAKRGEGPFAESYSPEVEQTLPLVDRLYAAFQETYPEAQVSCGKDWKAVEWFDKSSMYRAIWDLICLNRGSKTFIGDYKSGKYYPLQTHDDEGKPVFGQLHLSALIAMKRFDVPEVNCAYIYLEHKKTVPVVVNEDNCKPIQLYFEEKFEVVQLEKAWAPKKNEHCKWCEATRAQCPNAKINI